MQLPTPHPLSASHPNTKYIFQNNNRQNPSPPSHLLLANRIKNTKQTRLIEIFDLTIGERLLRMEAMDRSVRIHPWTKAWAPQESIYGRKEGKGRGADEGQGREYWPSWWRSLLLHPLCQPPDRRSRTDGDRGQPCTRVYAACAQPHKVSRCATPYTMVKSTLCGNRAALPTILLVSSQQPPLSNVPTIPRVPFIFQGLFIDEGRRKPNSIKVGSKRFCDFFIN